MRVDKELLQNELLALDRQLAAARRSVAMLEGGVQVLQGLIGVCDKPEADDTEVHEE